MIKIPKTKNLEVECYFTFGLLKEQKKQLEEEAEEKDMPTGKLIRRKLFPKEKPTKK